MEAFNNFTNLLKSCPTQEGVAIVEKIDKGTKYDPKSILEKWPTNLDEFSYVLVWNHHTKRLSQKKIDENSKGKYIKAGGKTLYIKDFKKPGSGSVIQDIQQKIHEHLIKYRKDDRKELEVICNWQTYNMLIEELQRTYTSCSHPFVGFQMFGVKVYYSLTTYEDIIITKVWRDH